MRALIVGAAALGVALLAIASCETTEPTQTASGDVISASTQGKSKLNCFTDDHKARLSFNNRGDDLVRLERYNPNSQQDVSETFVERVGDGSVDKQTTSFELSNGIEGKITILASGVCTDPNNGERYQMSLKIDQWGDVADGGYSDQGCCRVISE